VSGRRILQRSLEAGVFPGQAGHLVEHDHARLVGGEAAGELRQRRVPGLRDRELGEAHRLGQGTSGHVGGNARELLIAR